ncbi:MAG: hypothetical protein JWS12_81 [Candidatus Saccharibacteria bacterium]|nr:hypothetical protein [Candidatus Saccharibacteria bacterium]
MHLIKPDQPIDSNPHAFLSEDTVDQDVCPDCGSRACPGFCPESQINVNVLAPRFTCWNCQDAGCALCNCQPTPTRTVRWCTQCGKALNGRNAVNEICDACSHNRYDQFWPNASVSKVRRWLNQLTHRLKHR